MISNEYDVAFFRLGLGKKYKKPPKTISQARVGKRKKEADGRYVEITCAKASEQMNRRIRE